MKFRRDVLFLRYYCTSVSTTQHAIASFTSTTKRLLYAISVLRISFLCDLYFGFFSFFFFCAVLVFSCPILSRVINTQDARHRLLETE